MISVAMSEMIALVLEGWLYGMYLILFFACLTVAFNRRKESRGFNYVFLTTTFLLFVLITWHFVVDAVMLFIAYNHETTREADQYYANLPGTLNVMKTGLYIGVTLVSDAFMLYRCWVVWNRSFAIIALPSLLLLASIGTGIPGLIFLKNATTSFFTKELLPLTSAFFGITMATNNIATLLIAFRVWKGQREVSGISTMTNLNKVVMIVLESGAMYSATLIIILATFIHKSTSAYNVLIDVISPIIGIVFSLIIVRVGLNLSVRSDGRPQDPNSTVLIQSNIAQPTRAIRDHAQFELKLTNAASSRTRAVGSDGLDSKAMVDSTGDGLRFSETER
ncbi:hypothetical protein C8R43DRAFT_1142004 [Mycena crocata]|nr:hypothetical protein C8R43DRAFT_1142004 [Mycena crocata]